MTDLKSKNIWQRRADAIVLKVTQLLSIAIIYLFSELLIWGISRLLSGVRCAFFSSIIGMVLVFVVTTTLYGQLPLVDDLYRAYVKPMVSCIPECRYTSGLTM